MTEYKRWLPIILFSIFLYVLYNLNRFYKTENFDMSPFSLSGSGIQIRFQQDECLDDLSWISADNNYTCEKITEPGPGCYFSDVNGFTGFDKCPRSCDNCQDQLFPGDSPNNTMLSAPDALYDNESGEMIGQVTQGAMNMGNSTMATFSDKRLYEIEEEFDERLSSMEGNISELLESVYDDILLAIEEQSGRDATCLKNFDTNLDGKAVSELTDEEKTSILPNRCTDLHLDGFGAIYCDTVEDCLKCGDPDSDCDTEFNLVDGPDPISNCTYNIYRGGEEEGQPKNTEPASKSECCTGEDFDPMNTEVGSCFYDGSDLTYDGCCFNSYELNFPSYKRGDDDDDDMIPKTKYNLSVNLNDDQDQINVNNLDKCINKSSEEFEVFKWIPTDVSPVGDNFDEMPVLEKDNPDINRNLGIMLPMNITTNCYELKDMKKHFGENLTDYSCKNQIFTKSEDRGRIHWKNLYERCPIRCNENCRNLFDPDEGLQIKEDGNINLFSELRIYPEAHYESNDNYLRKISNKLHTSDDPPQEIAGKRHMIDDIKKYLGVGNGIGIDSSELFVPGIEQQSMNIKIDDNQNE